MHDFAELDELLEAAQVVADLGAERLGKETRDLFSELASRRMELGVEEDLSASVGGSGSEPHHAGGVEMRPLGRSPGDLLIPEGLCDLDVPFQGDASGSG